MVNHRFDVIPFATALGADVHGLDLSQPLDDDQFEALRSAWIEHSVLAIRDQEIVALFARDESWNHELGAGAELALAAVARAA